MADEQKQNGSAKNGKPTAGLGRSDYAARVEKMLKQNEHREFIHEPAAAETAVALPEK